MDTRSKIFVFHACSQHDSGDFVFRSKIFDNLDTHSEILTIVCVRLRHVPGEAIKRGVGQNQTFEKKTAPVVHGLKNRVS